MASKATILLDSPGRIVVRVDHRDTDSFSRSVDRAAMAARRKCAHANSANHMSGDYAVSIPTVDRECVSVVTFAASNEAARALLDEWLPAVNASSPVTNAR